MEEEGEDQTLTSLGNKITADKQEILFKKASIKVKSKLIQHYRFKYNQIRHGNKKYLETISKKKIERIQLMEHLARLRSMNHSIENYHNDLKRALYEQKETNKKLQIYNEKNIQKYAELWAQRKAEYESSDLAIERKTLQTKVKCLEFQNMQQSHKLECLIQARKKMEFINTHRNQNIVINFAKFMVENKIKRQMILNLQKSIEENQRLSLVLSEKTKLKLLRNEMTSSSIIDSDQMQDSNLPVNLILYEKTYQTSVTVEDMPAFKDQIAKSDISHKSNSSQAVISHLFQLENVNGNQIDTYVEENEAYINNKVSIVETYIHNERSNDNYNFLSNQDMNAENQRNNDNEGVQIQSNKKIEIIQTVVLSSKETEKLLKSIHVDEKCRENFTNKNIVNVSEESLKIIKSTDPPTVVIEKQQSTKMSQIRDSVPFNTAELQEITQHHDQEKKPHEPASTTDENNKMDSLNIINNTQKDNTFEMLPTKLFPDKNENKETAKHNEEQNLLNDLMNKFNLTKSPKSTYSSDNLKQQMILSTSNASVSKFFQTNENNELDQGSICLIDKNKKNEATNQKEGTYLSPQNKRLRTDSYGTQMEKKFQNPGMPYIGNSTNYFGTQSTFISDLAPSAMSYDFNLSEDDSNMSNSGMEFSMIKGNYSSPTSDEKNNDSCIKSPEGNANEQAQPSFLFGEQNPTNKDMKPESKKTEDSVFNFLFKRSDKEPSFFNLFN